jgi:chromosome segregation ATPase
VQAALAKKDKDVEALAVKLHALGSANPAVKPLADEAYSMSAKFKQETEATKKVVTKASEDGSEAGLDLDRISEEDGAAKFKQQASLLRSANTTFRGQMAVLKDIKRVAESVVAAVYDEGSEVAPGLMGSIEVLVELLNRAPSMTDLEAGEALVDEASSLDGRSGAGAIPSNVDAKQVQLLHAELGREKKKVETLKAELQAMTTRSNDTRAKMEEALAKREQLAKDLTDVTSKRDALTRETQAKALEVDRISGELTQSRLIIEKMRAKDGVSADAAAALGKLERQLAVVTAERDAAVAKCTSGAGALEKQLAVITAERDAAVARNTTSTGSAQQQLSAAMAERDTAVRAAAAANAEISALKESLASTSASGGAEQSKLSGDLARARGDLAELRAKSSQDVEAAKREAAGKISALEGEIASIRAQQKEVAASLGSSTQQYESKIAQLTAQVHEKSADLAAAEKKLADLSAELQGAKSATRELQETADKQRMASEKSSTDRIIQLSTELQQARAKAETTSAAAAKTTDELNQQLEAVRKEHAKELQREAQRLAEAQQASQSAVVAAVAEVRKQLSAEAARTEQQHVSTLMHAPHSSSSAPIVIVTRFAGTTRASP